MNDCHCEAPLGQRSNLDRLSTIGARLLRFARNDSLGFAAGLALLLFTVRLGAPPACTATVGLTAICVEQFCQ